MKLPQRDVPLMLRWQIRRIVSAAAAVAAADRTASAASHQALCVARKTASVCIEEAPVLRSIVRCTLVDNILVVLAVLKQPTVVDKTVPMIQSRSQNTYRRRKIMHTAASDFGKIEDVMEIEY